MTENIAGLMVGMNGLVFQAVRRQANGLADYLANYDIDNQDEVWDTCWQQVDCPDLKEKCLQLAEQDLDNAGRDLPEEEWF